MHPKVGRSTRRFFSTIDAGALLLHLILVVESCQRCRRELAAYVMVTPAQKRPWLVFQQARPVRLALFSDFEFIAAI